MSDQAYGLWVGLAVDNMAEATAAGALYSDAAAQFAVLAKTARNATIGFVVLGFLAVSVPATIGAFSRPRATDLANLSRWAFLFSCAGIGLRTNLRLLSNPGWRPLIVGIVGECAIAGLTLALVLGAAKWLV
jgi:uncharacterized membrane protein YadS